MGDIVNSVADLFGAGPASKQAGAVTNAANISAKSAADALALQKQMYEQGIARQQPFMDIGTNALNRLVALNQGGPGGADAAQNFLTMDPGYQFRLNEGMKALERSAAARGGLLSGGAGKALSRYGQDYASGEYQNAYNRLAGLASLGPSAAGIMNNLGTNYAGTATNTGMVGGANAANAALMQGNIGASQYGTLGRGINQAMNTDWSKVFGGGGSNPYDQATASATSAWMS